MLQRAYRKLGPRYVERALFAELNGFDQRFRIAAHEDQDLFLRIKKHTVVPFIAEAAVSHPVAPIML